MKNVLYIHQSAEMYGSDKVLLYLVSGLLKEGNFFPIVVLPEIGPLHHALTACGVEVHVGEVAKISRATISPFGLLRLAWQAVKSLRSLDRIVAGRPIAVVHSNTLAVLSGAIWSICRHKKHLWHVHEIILRPRPVSRAFPYLVNRLADRVISVSTLTESWLLSQQPNLAPLSVVVFNGLPNVAPASEMAVRSFRESIGAVADDVVITLAGRIHRWKGQELLLQAAAHLKNTGRMASLRIVIIGSAAPGQENLPDALRALAISEGIDDRVTFLPFIDDIWPAWFGSDIAVVPSTEPESFGMVAIEAMAAGVPVIASKLGGLLDIVVDQETGLFFTPSDSHALADAISQLALSKVRRITLGSAGKIRQQALFSVASQVALTSKTYDSLI